MFLVLLDAALQPIECCGISWNDHTKRIVSHYVVVVAAPSNRLSLVDVDLAFGQDPLVDMDADDFAYHYVDGTHGRVSRQFEGGVVLALEADRGCSDHGNRRREGP